MILIDVNLLLHAYNPRAREHEASRLWLERTLSGPQFVRVAWLSLWAFLRISTNPRVFEHPLSMPEAGDVVSSFARFPGLMWVNPLE